MKIVATIEARMTSTRLPGKVIMKVRNKPLLEYLVDRLKKIKSIDDIVLCTTTKKTDDVLLKLSKKLKIKIYRGSENNVLKRVYYGAKKYNANTIVQITADCPIIDYRIVSKAISLFKNNSLDCVSNSFIRSFPDGMDVNVISMEALEKTFSMAIDKNHKEHVTLFIKDNPNKFKIKNMIAKNNFFCPQLGVTLDEKKDFLLIKKIINYFYDKNYYFSCQDIIKIVKKKGWMKINSAVKRKGYDIRAIKK